MKEIHADSGQDTLRAQLLWQGALRDSEQLLLLLSVTCKIPLMVLGAARNLPSWLAGCCDAAVISAVKPLDRIGEQMTDTRP